MTAQGTTALNSTPRVEHARRNSAPAVLRAVANGVEVPLQIDQHCNTPTDERYEHCRIAKTAGFPVLVNPGKSFTKAPCVLVGSGLSAIALLPEIRERYQAGEEIIAIKGAHDWLLKNGITPRAAIATDAQRSRAKCFRKPTAGVLYLCASQMHPDTWKHLRGRKVVVWHQRIGMHQHVRDEFKDDYLVMCASSTGNSALILMYELGRRNFHLYGFDSCVAEPTWINRWIPPMMKLDGQRTPRDKQVMTVCVGDRRFYSTPELIVQVQEIPHLLDFLDGSELAVHGDSYYKAVFESMADADASAAA